MNREQKYNKINRKQNKTKQNIGTNKAKLVQMYKSEIILYTI